MSDLFTHGFVNLVPDRRKLYQSLRPLHDIRALRFSGNLEQFVNRGEGEKRGGARCRALQSLVARYDVHLGALVFAPLVQNLDDKRIRKFLAVGLIKRSLSYKVAAKNR